MKTTRYKFIGKPDERFPSLVTGKVYNLEIKEYGKGAFGKLVGNTWPQIISPIMCPYRNWDTFYANWE
jgi:hypothetical protein